VQAGQLDEAEAHYRTALAGKPTAESYNGLGYVLARQDRTDDAIAEFRKAIDANPKFVPAYNNLGEALAKQGKLQEAADAYRRSLAEKPSPAVQQALDAVLRKLGTAAADGNAQLGKADAAGAAR
jgi:superkiller protein 3